MSTVDELLSSGLELTPCCIIDPYTREITVPSEYDLFGVESDEDVKRIRFRCPKVVDDNVDLTTFNIYVNYRNANGDGNVYLVEDVIVDGDDITFSWLLSRQVNMYAGSVNFIVCAKRSDDSGIVQEWNTKVAVSNVGEGLETTAEIIERSSDVIEQILLKLDTTDAETSKTIKEIRKELQTLSVVQNSHKTTIEGLEETAVNHGKSIETITKDLSAHVKQYDEDKAVIDADLEGIKKTQSDTATVVDKLEKNFDTYKQSVSETFDDTSKSIENLSKSLNATNESVSDLSKHVSENFPNKILTVTELPTEPETDVMYLVVESE